MMSLDVDTAARRAAAGSMALMADGDEDAAKEMLRLYLSDVFASHGPIVAYQCLIGAVIGVSLLAVDDAERFRRIAAVLSVGRDECV